MIISKDLYLAILSMDAYNRGYGVGIGGLGGVGSEIGGTTVLTDSETVAVTKDRARAAGFYAVAYTVHGVDGIADGSTVISYRGTDFTPDPGMADDIRDGWPVGGGNDIVISFWAEVVEPRDDIPAELGGRRGAKTGAVQRRHAWHRRKQVPSRNACRRGDSARSPWKRMAPTKRIERAG